MLFIDTHAHLDHLENVEQALVQAAEAGVSDIIAVSVDLKANKRNLELKKSIQRPRIHVALGIHPGNIVPDEVEETLRFIREHIKEAVAIGETGLDYWYKWAKKDEAKKAEQRQLFRRQLELAREFDLPVVIHSRGAWRDCLTMTRDAGVKKAVFHWYSGPVDVLNDIVASGYMVSTTPSLAYSPPSREAISQAPIEHTMIETDCPVYYQEGEDGRFQATPKDVARTLKAYVALKNVDESKALAVFNENARRFFGI